jgi:hypothetical protein
MGFFMIGSAAIIILIIPIVIIEILFKEIEIVDYIKVHSLGLKQEEELHDHIEMVHEREINGQVDRMKLEKIHFNMHATRSDWDHIH